MNKADLAAAQEGSWYTILGAGGDLSEWVNGYQEMLTEQGIGTPKAWYTSTGKDVNDYLAPEDNRDCFQDDLVILMFPLDGLNVGKLAMFKLQMEDKWFDDIAGNIRRPDEDEEEL